MDPDPPSSARQRRRQVESVRKEIDKIEWVFKKKEAEGKKASEAVERNYAKLKVRLEMLKAVLKEAQAAQEREGDDLSAGDLDGGCSDGLYHDFGGAEVGEAHRHVAGD